MSMVHSIQNIRKGRVARDEDREFQRNQRVELSVTQAKKNTESAHSRGFLWMTDLFTELPIRISDESERPTTVLDKFVETARAFPDSQALAYQIWNPKTSEYSKEWTAYTWKMYFDTVCLFAKALMAKGFGDRDRLCIMGIGSAFWAIANFGAIFANGVAAAIYPTNNQEATEYILEKTEARVVVVDTATNLEKIIKAKKDGHCPHLNCIVIYNDPVPEYSTSNVFDFGSFLNCGFDVSDLLLERQLAKLKPGATCELLFTSGTTGNPKGVMLTHDNLISAAVGLTSMLETTDTDRIVSYLPMSHIAGQISDLYIPLTKGICTYFARHDALQGSLVETLVEVRPTFFFAVPRVWEKMEEKLKAFGQQKPAIMQRIANVAKDIVYRGCTSLLDGGRPPWGFTIAEKFVASRVRDALGLGQCMVFGSGAAPLNSATQKYFLSLGIPICDIYGLTETSGPITSNAPIPSMFMMGTVGNPLLEAEVFINDTQGDGEGEVCFRGRQVFAGYYTNEPATREAIDEFGWFRTGDIGKISSDGFLKITGRLKELIITAGGENVSPALIEHIVKEEMPYIANCMVVGDRLKYLSVLLTLKVVMELPLNNPTNTLSPEVVAFFKSANANITTVDEARSNPIVARIINDGISRVNKRMTSRAQRLQKWRILRKDFSESGGELTPTLKLKRGVVTKMYSDQIASMYEEDAPDKPNTKF